MSTTPLAAVPTPEPKPQKSLPCDRQLGIVRYSPSGKLLVAGGLDGTLRRWTTEGECVELPKQSGFGGWVTSLAFHPEGATLFVGDSWGGLSAWTDLEGEPRKLWQIESAHDGWIRGVAVSADGQEIATAGSDRRVRLSSTSDGALVREFRGHADDIYSVTYAPDGELIVSGDLKGNILAWRRESGELVRKFDGSVFYQLSRLQDVGGVRRLIFDPTGKQLAAAGMTPKNGGSVQGKPTIVLYDFASGEKQHTFNVGTDSDGFFHDCVYHPRGLLIAVTSGNPGTGKVVCGLPSSDPPYFVYTKLANCHSLALHPDGASFIVASTNTGSNGNGRPLKEGEYKGNFSPLTRFDLPPEAESTAGS